MDFPGVLATIEKACAESQHPATRYRAEQILLEFKNSPNIVPVCQYILANSAAPFVQFNAASAITTAIVREYGLYQNSDIQNLRAYLISYNLQHPKTVSYVSKQIYQAIAVISKRGWLEATLEEQDVVYSNILHLLSMGDQEKKVGLFLAGAMVDEFSSSGKASNVGLTWDFHHKTKRSFEERYLRLIFEATLKVLHEQLQDLINNPGQEISGSLKPLLGQSILLVDSILDFDFATGSQPVLAGTFADDEDDTSKNTLYPESWRSVLVNADVLSMVFSLYSMVQDDSIMMHRVRQCLIQLCGLHGPIFENEVQTRSHVSSVMQGLLKLIDTVSSCSTNDCLQADYADVLVAITEMIRQLLSFHSIQTICAVPECYEFLNEVAKLTVHCLKESSENPEESENLMEAFDALLVTWVKLVQDAEAGLYNSSVPNMASDSAGMLQFFRSISFRIVEKYIATRMDLAKFNALEEEEDDGLKDWETYGDQLLSIAVLARLDPHQSLLCIQGLLHDRIERLKEFLRTGDGNISEYLTCIHEHLHWLLVITGHIFSDNSVGETAMVPDSLNDLSTSQSLDQDQVVNIFRVLMGLLDAVSLDSHSVQAIACSPQVAQSLFWFLERWVKTYLFISPDNYSSVSPNLQVAFGEASQGGEGTAMAEFLISKMTINFTMWNADAEVLLQIIRVMNAFGAVARPRQALLQSEQFPPLVSFFLDNLAILPEVVHNPLIQSITSLISYSPTEQLNGHYFQLISKAIETRFVAALHHKDFERNYQYPEVMSAIMNGLEMFNGLVLALTELNTSMIYKFCERYFESFVSLIRVYRQFPEVQILILRLFTDLTLHVELSALRPAETQNFLNILLSLLNTFSAVNLGIKRGIEQEEAEEEPYQDISMVLRLLLALLDIMGGEQLVKDSAATLTASGSLSSETTVLPSTVVFLGASAVIPMMKENMLKIPRLCTLYIRLISKLVASFPERLCQLPEGLLKQLMASLEFGMDHAISEIGHLTFEAIAALALHSHHATLVARHHGSHHHPQMHEAQARMDTHLDQFLRRCFEQLLFKTFAMELVDIAGTCVLSLVCARPQSYSPLIHELMGSTQVPLTEELTTQLSNSFNVLSEAFPSMETMASQQLTMRDVAMTPVRRDIFLRFLMGVRGVLRVK